MNRAFQQTQHVGSMGQQQELSRPQLMDKYGIDSPPQSETRRRMVDVAIDELNETIASLGNAVETLTGRLAPVLNLQPSPCDPEDKLSIDPPRCKLADLLVHETHRLLALEKHVRETLSRLEV